MKSKNQGERAILHTNILNAVLITVLFFPLGMFSQILVNNTNLSITKSWTQEPNGYAYPTALFVPPGPPPQGGFPVCILLHGNGGHGQAMIGQFINTLQCHILVAPTGYDSTWNICAEVSDAPDIEMIEDLVNNLQTYVNVNASKIRIVGSSNGAGLANRVFIENNDTGIDLVCAIVSQLNEPQYHAGNFHGPSSLTDPNSSFCGYDNVSNPLPSRKYLSICNDNDPIIPYQGGSSVVGVSFLAAETAAFMIATHNGYTGSILTTGTTMGNPAITEYSYLSGDVVHIKGSEGHQLSTTQKDYIKTFLGDCAPPVGLEDQIESKIEIYPNPTSGFVHVKSDVASIGSTLSVYDYTGKYLFSDIVDSENMLIELGDLPEGLYLIMLENQTFKVVKR